jgi:2-polyprenyl-6-methoxyphenol hydroxylase-like FAD-dependent oxidoreductase
MDASGQAGQNPRRAEGAAVAGPVRVGGHGLVLGASIAGLVTARVLSDYFDRVTIVERDVLPDGPDHRRGVPQDRHPHVLQVGGAQALDDLFPGILDELEAAGSAVVIEDYSKFHFDVGGHIIAKSGLPKNPVTFYLQTRPFLESHVRRRVRKLATVTILDGHTVTELTSTGSGAVTGAKVTSPGGDREIIAADLVVDAMGRGGRTPAFLDRHGFDPPAEDRVVARVTYSAQLVHWPIDTLQGVVVGVEATPRRPIGMSLIPQENSIAMFWLGGMVGHEPPTQFPAMIECAEQFSPPDVIAALRVATPLGPASQHRIPAAVWRRYDRMRTFPEGLLVLGDAISVFNPTYGQGMSVAALHALALQRCLAKGGQDLARRFFKAAAKPTAAAWGMAAAADLAYPEARGHRNLQVRLGHRLEKPLLTAAETDIEVYSQVLKVSAFVDPPSSLLSPGFLLRLLRGALRPPKDRGRAPHGDGIERLPAGVEHSPSRR